MSKSAIYTTNVSAPTVAVGGIVPFGTTTRRYGCNIRQDGNAITLCGQGYYLVNISATLAPTAAGTVSLTAQKDGVAVPGATASATAAAADDALDLNITALVRQVCCAAGSALTLVLTGAAASVENVALRVQRI